MTFKDEATRLFFHSLPTETQVQYTDWEVRLAKRNARLHIDAVISIGKVSEIVVRITEDFKFGPVDTYATRSEHTPEDVVDVPKVSPSKL